MTWSLMALAVIGCSGSDRPELGEVAGRVTLDGKALAHVGVVFQPEALRPSTAYTDDNGQYKLTYIRDLRGAAVGRHQVMIYRTAQRDGERYAAENLPARYNEKTELSAEVKPGSNVFDFELLSTP